MYPNIANVATSTNVLIKLSCFGEPASVGKRIRRIILDEENTDGTKQSGNTDGTYRWKRQKEPMQTWNQTRNQSK